MAGEVDDGEQQIADFRRRPRALSPASIACFDLVGLLADLGEHRQRIVPVEADLAGLLLQLERAGQGGQGDRHAGERTRSLGRRAAARLGAFGLLLGLDAVPQAFDRLGRKPARLAEHMRMPADQLGGDGLDHVAEVERALLLRHAGVEHDLEQEVAQFVPQVDEIAARDRVGDLVGFLDRVGRDASRSPARGPRGSRVPGVRSAAMISISRGMSREGVMPLPGSAGCSSPSGPSPPLRSD